MHRRGEERRGEQSGGDEGRVEERREDWADGRVTTLEKITGLHTRWLAAGFFT